jgi:ribonucleoside-diphosphate reductase alpha chain
VDPTGILGDDNARTVFDKRWTRKDDNGRSVETVAQAMHRVAECVSGGAPDAFFDGQPAFADASLDAVAKLLPGSRPRLLDAFEGLLKTLRFLPNSPTWTGAGTPLGQLAACFVLPIEDDMGRSQDGIMSTLRHAALIQQTGGGNGFSFSRLRPKGSLVKSSMGVSSGPIAFLRAYDAVFGTIAQGGTRRGANMAVLRVDHPDIREFIRCKATESDVTNFNISVGVTDAFMEAYTEGNMFALVDPSTGRTVETVDPRELMREIADCAHRNGEPGVLFLDRANAQNPVPDLYTLEATNPCGEQWLGPYENCCLGSVNLARHTKTVAGKPGVDWDRLRETVVYSTVFLDCMVSANKYVPAVPQLYEAAMKCRRIGLGVMGLADLMLHLGVPYGSENGCALAEKVMRFVRHWTLAASMVLASVDERFPGFANSVYDPDGTHWTPGLFACFPFMTAENLHNFGLRNAAQNTIAPTGTLSTVAGCDGYGCEPVFALAYNRYVVVGGDDERMVLRYVSRPFEDAVRHLYSGDDARIERILEAAAQTGSCQHIEELHQTIKDAFVVSGDISVEGHVNMQASLQKYVDNSISKTINMPDTATPEDVTRTYVSAWRKGCKGITVYVTGSRDKVVLETAETFADVQGSPTGLPLSGDCVRVARPDVLAGYTFRGDSPVGKLLCTINEITPGQPVEVIMTASKAGSETAAIAEAMGRLISTMLRLDCPIPTADRLRCIAKQLVGIGGQRSVGLGPRKVRSMPDGLAKLIHRYLDTCHLTEPPLIPSTPDDDVPAAGFEGADLCPDCGQASYVRIEGCIKCLVCGRSEC